MGSPLHIISEVPSLHIISDEMTRNAHKQTIPGFIPYTRGGELYIGTADSLKRECCIEFTWVYLQDIMQDHPDALVDMSILLYILNGER